MTPISSTTRPTTSILPPPVGPTQSASRTASETARFAVVRPAAKPTAGPGDLRQAYERIEQISGDYAKAQASFAERISRREIKPGDGVFEAESRKLYDMMLGLQQVSQSYSMRVELLSKVVEHATSSTKTLLQTQT